MASFLELTGCLVGRIDWGLIRSEGLIGTILCTLEIISIKYMTMLHTTRTAHMHTKHYKLYRVQAVLTWVG